MTDDIKSNETAAFNKVLAETRMSFRAGANPRPIGGPLVGSAQFWIGFDFGYSKAKNMVGKMSFLARLRFLFSARSPLDGR